jgi:hypothetical protein
VALSLWPAAALHAVSKANRPAADAANGWRKNNERETGWIDMGVRWCGIARPRSHENSRARNKVRYLIQIVAK